MDTADVDSWLQRYIAAWESYDRSEIGDLFAEDAQYRYHPYDDPVVGREAIVESWLEEDRLDQPGSWEARYEAFAVDGDRAVATGLKHVLRERCRRPRLRQRLRAALRRRRPLLRVHGVVHAAAVRRAAASRSAAAFVVICSASASS